MARKERVPRKARRERKPRSKRLVDDAIYAPDNQKEAGYWDWLNSRHRAAKILDACPERPYWAFIRDVGGTPPVAGYYPCTMFRKSGRIFYGFLIRDHRERFVKKFRDLHARRILTGDNNGPLLE